MPAPLQRSFPNPAPQTDSARETLKSFYCTLCQKGYSRAHEFAAHESSYEHNHKQRLKDLKAMNRNMADATATGTRKEEDAKAGLIKITPIAVKGAGAGGFKKGGFKSAFGKVEGKTDVEDEKEVVTEILGKASSVTVASKVLLGQESDTDDEGYEVYDPRRPTDCGPQCKARR